MSRFRIVWAALVIATVSFAAVDAPAFGQRVRHGSGNGGMSNARVPGGVADVVYVIGSGSDGTTVGESLACITITVGATTDTGCTLDPDEATVDGDLTSGRIRIVAPSDSQAGKFLTADLTFTGQGTQRVGSPLEASNSASDVSVTARAQVSRDATPSGTVSSDVLGGSWTIGSGWTSATLFRGGEVEVAAGDSPEGGVPRTRWTSHHLNTPAFSFDRDQARSSLSGDGRYVAFIADAGMMPHPEDDAEGPDAFLYDRFTDLTTRLSQDGAIHVSIAGSGRYVVLLVARPSGLEVEVLDLATGAREVLGTVAAGVVPSRQALAISADGRFVASASGWNHQTKVWDRDSAAAPAVLPGSTPRIADDGRYLLLDDPICCGAKIYDLQAQPPVVVFQAADRTAASLSPDGRSLCFMDWVVHPGRTADQAEVFLTSLDGDGDRVIEPGEQTTVLVSVPNGGGFGNGYSGYNGQGGSCAVSADGRVVAFHSQASNLVGDPLLDEEGVSLSGFNVYARDVSRGITELISAAADGSGRPATMGTSENPQISDSGRFVAFTSWARDVSMPPPVYDPNQDFPYQLFLRDRATQ